MTQDDLPLNRPTPRLSPDPPAHRSSLLQWILVGLGGVAAGALLTFWWMSRSQPTTAPPPSATVTDTTAESSRPKRQPIDLPALDESDTLLRSLVSVLSNNPTLARFLATDGIVRGGTLAVVQIGEGRTPNVPLASLRPSTRMSIVGTITGPLNADSYARWDGVAAAVASIDPTEAAQLYVNVKPLIDEAYIDLGYSDGDFDAAIVRAIEMLRATPTVGTPPTLQRRSGYYDYADPTLRALKPVQKQFLLMGPDNQRRILAWLARVGAALDLDLR